MREFLSKENLIHYCLPSSGMVFLVSGMLLYFSDLSMLEKKISLAYLIACFVIVLLVGVGCKKTIDKYEEYYDELMYEWFSNFKVVHIFMTGITLSMVAICFSFNLFFASLFVNSVVLFLYGLSYEVLLK